jgi:phage tail protein X
MDKRCILHYFTEVFSFTFSQPADMTTDDFIFILIEAFAHQDPKEFFKSRQKLWHKKEKYSKKSFSEGLLKTFKWLYYQVHLPDRRNGRIKLADDQETDEYISSPATLQELKNRGELSFPYPNFILVCRSSDQRVVLVLNKQTLDELWIPLFHFLNPYSERMEPPKIEEDTLRYDCLVETIFIPEPIYRYFQPLDDNDPESVEPAKPGLAEANPSLPVSFQLSLPPDCHLNLRQAALILFYSGQMVTRENGDAYARYFGYTSGEKLYHYFSHYSNHTDRRAGLETHLKTMNKIKLFEEILPYLPSDGKEAALKDIEKIKTTLMN